MKTNKTEGFDYFLAWVIGPLVLVTTFSGALFWVHEFSEPSLLADRLLDNTPGLLVLILIGYPLLLLLTGLPVIFAALISKSGLAVDTAWSASLAVLVGNLLLFCTIMQLLNSRLPAAEFLIPACVSLISYSVLFYLTLRR